MSELSKGLPKGHSWSHKGGLYFLCKNCGCRVIKEIVRSKKGFIEKVRLQVSVDNDWIISQEKVPDTCEEANMNEALI